MTGKEFYTEFFGVKDPKEKGTTINVSVWIFAEAYAEQIKKVQSLTMNSVVKSFICDAEEKGGSRCETQCLGCDGFQRMNNITS